MTDKEKLFEIFGAHSSDWVLRVVAEQLDTWADSWFSDNPKDSYAKYLRRTANVVRERIKEEVTK